MADFSSTTNGLHYDADRALARDGSYVGIGGNRRDSDTWSADQREADQVDSRETDVEPTEVVLLESPGHPELHVHSLESDGLASNQPKAEPVGDRGRNWKVATSVIIPVFNEEAALPLVLKSLFYVLDNTYEVVVVDDGSTDKSVQVALEFPCRLIQHSINLGKGAALRTGLREAHGKSVIFIDADNTYPVELIPTMAKMLKDHDLVRGVREAGRENIPPLNRVGNLLFDRVIHALHPVEGGDLLSGMYGGNREALLGLGLESEGFDIETEITVKAQARGLTCKTVPITYLERVGEKKLRAFRDGLRILYRLLQLTVAYNPLLVFITPGLFFVALGVVGVLLPLILLGSTGELTIPPNVPIASGVLGTLGFQLTIFGLAVYSAGVANGVRGRASLTLDTISHLFRGRPFILFGLGLLTAGVLGLSWLLFARLFHLAPTQHDSWTILGVSSLCLLIGVQMLSAIAFLSALEALQATVRNSKR